jgi:hypothetical protein
VYVLVDADVSARLHRFLASRAWRVTSMSEHEIGSTACTQVDHRREPAIFAANSAACRLGTRPASTRMLSWR